MNKPEALTASMPSSMPGPLSEPLDAADQALVDGVLACQLRALAKTITLTESQRDDHRARAQKVLEALLPHTGGAMRVGISGVPGVGSSPSSRRSACT